MTLDARQREIRRLAAEARHAAEAQLVENHREEFDRLYWVAATARGVTPRGKNRRKR